MMHTAMKITIMLVALILCRTGLSDDELFSPDRSCQHIAAAKHYLSEGNFFWAAVVLREAQASCDCELCVQEAEVLQRLCEAMAIEMLLAQPHAERAAWNQEWPTESATLEVAPKPIVATLERERNRLEEPPLLLKRDASERPLLIDSTNAGISDCKFLELTLLNSMSEDISLVQSESAETSSPEQDDHFTAESSTDKRPSQSVVSPTTVAGREVLESNQNEESVSSMNIRLLVDYLVYGLLGGLLAREVARLFLYRLKPWGNCYQDDLKGKVDCNEYDGRADIFAGIVLEVDCNEYDGRDDIFAGIVHENVNAQKAVRSRNSIASKS